MSQSIVKSSLVIKKHLRARFKELGLSNESVALEARHYGLKLFKQQLTRYFNNTNPINGFPSEEIIIWMCFRYGIDIKLHVKPQRFNNKKCLEKIKKFF